MRSSFWRSALSQRETLLSAIIVAIVLLVGWRSPVFLSWQIGRAHV